MRNVYEIFAFYILQYQKFIMVRQSHLTTGENNVSKRRHRCYRLSRDGAEPHFKYERPRV